jgi:hypothetical protein
MVPVTSVQYRNTYVFSDRINFFVPYALCTLVALIYVVVGIRALARNGVPATDGGFLQIMMATRGKTQMEKLVLETGFVGTKDLPKGLLDMRVRLGELVAEINLDGEESGRRQVLGFGTMEETVALTRRGNDHTVRENEG